MHGAFFVGSLQRQSDLISNLYDFNDRKRSALEQFRQGHTLDKFQYQVRRAAAFNDIVNGSDVWMIERGQKRGFLFETCEPFRVIGKFGREYFNRYIAFQPGVSGS